MGSRSRKRGRAGAEPSPDPRPAAATPAGATEDPRSPAQPDATPAPAASRPGAGRPPRAAEGPEPTEPAATTHAEPAATTLGEPASPDPLRDRYARGRARDEAIRMSLEPLAPGERPRVVTIAAIVAFAFAIANVVATLTVDDLSSDNGNPATVAVVTTGILVVAGAGMLARKYWAVLGFQCVLGLQIVVFSLALTRVQKWWVGLALTIAIGLLGVLFWKLIRAMARLQMPERPGEPVHPPER